MPTLPKTLVLTHFPVGYNNGTIRHLEPLFERYGQDLIWYSIRAPSGSAPAPPVAYGYGGHLNRPTRARRVLRYLNYGPGAWRAAHLAAAFGRHHGARVVMAVMSGQAIVAAAPTARALGVPLALWISDDPPSIFARSSLPPAIQRFAASRFRSTMREAASYGVISTDLAETYRAQFAVDPLVLYKGVDPRTCQAPPIACPTDEVIIGSVGTINSDENWMMLLAAVRLLNERSNRRYKIVHVGNLPDALRAPEVEVTGWLGPDSLAPVLQRFHLCYLSLWFDQSTVSLTAFPTKITSYLQAQRPILAFGSPGSRIVKLVDEQRCGIACTTPSETALAASIERVMEKHAYRDALTGMARARDEYSIDKFFANFEAVIQRADSSSNSVYAGRGLR